MARRLGATLIVMGIGRHAPIDRLMGSETVLQVLQVAEVPILAVAPDLMGAPHRVLAAVDFSGQSETAAGAAAELLADGGTLMLMHVRHDPAGMRPPKAPVDLYAAGAAQRFGEIERQLHRHPDTYAVERIVCDGDPASELLTLTDVPGIDLVAVGAQTHGRMHRIFLGSIAARLLRSVRCSVLVIPVNAERTRRRKRSAASNDARTLASRVSDVTAEALP